MNPKCDAPKLLAAAASPRTQQRSQIHSWWGFTLGFTAILPLSQEHTPTQSSHFELALPPQCCFRSDATVTVTLH